MYNYAPMTDITQPRDTSYLGRKRPDHRLVGQRSVDCQSRAPFFGAAAHTILCIRICHERARVIAKRSGLQRMSAPADLDTWTENQSSETLALSGLW